MWLHDRQSREPWRLYTVSAAGQLDRSIDDSQRSERKNTNAARHVRRCFVEVVHNCLVAEATTRYGAGIYSTSSYMATRESDDPKRWEKHIFPQQTKCPFFRTNGTASTYYLPRELEQRLKQHISKEPLDIIQYFKNSHPLALEFFWRENDYSDGFGTL